VALSENPEFAASYRLLEAQLMAAEGHPEQAVAHVLQTLEGFHREAATWLPFLALEVGAEIQDDQLLRQLVGSVEGARSRGARAQLARLRARLAEHDAIAELLEAERLFRELGAVFYLACVRIERAEQLLAIGRPDEAEPLLHEAREVFAQLRATPWLERVDAARGVTASAVSA
jgi:hypothetical protein